MNDLAILGGPPVLDAELPRYRSMGQAELDAVVEVMASDCLSGFYGSPGPEFLGGAKVRAFEEAWSERFGVRHAVSVNSATSGLIAAMGAIGIGPGDEVILPPWTMSATAMAPLVYGGLPVFADVEADTFCLDPQAVRAEITPRTKAILAVNLFGHPARLEELRLIAEAHGLWLVEDNAQAPLASEHGRAAGTVGHIGIFSFNFHKHIHTGEGGMCVTEDDRLAERLRLIRNHGENVVEAGGHDELVNMVGFNFRLTELSAAVGLAQLADIDRHVGRRERVAEALTAGLDGLDGLRAPMVREGCRHNYYCWCVRYDEAAMGVSRDTFCRALAAEGFPLGVGYVRPLYLLPLFQERIAIGAEGFPFSLSNRTYPKGLCPVAERLHEKEAFLFEPCAWSLDERHTELLVEALRKVHGRPGELAALERNGEAASA